MKMIRSAREDSWGAPSACESQNRAQVSCRIQRLQLIQNTPLLSANLIETLNFVCFQVSSSTSPNITTILIIFGIWACFVLIIFIISKISYRQAKLWDDKRTNRSNPCWGSRSWSWSCWGWWRWGRQCSSNIFAGQYLQNILVFSDTFEVEINGKLIFSKRQLGHYPERDEIVEITKWGNKVKTRYSRCFITPKRALYVHWFHLTL